MDDFTHWFILNYPRAVVSVGQFTITLSSTCSSIVETLIETSGSVLFLSLTMNGSPGYLNNCCIYSGVTLGA